MDMQKLSTAMDIAKFDLLSKPNSTFITTVMFSLNMRWEDDDSPIWAGRTPTLAVDGITMFINQAFFLQLTPELRISALAHETWHACFQHMTRRGERNPLFWNFAGDFVINAQLKDEGFEIDGGVTLDELIAGTGRGWLYDPKFKGMGTDEIYVIIQKAFEQQGQGDGTGIPMPADGLGEDVKEPSQGMTEDGISAQQAVQEQLDDILMKAQVQSKMIEDASGEKAGNLPGEIERFIENMLDPKIPWQTLLLNFFTSKAKNDYSMKRPNRRFIGDDIYMPSLYSDSLGEVAAFCDASGSVGRKEFDQFFAETNYIKGMMKPEKFTIASFDHQIQSVHTFTKDRELGYPELKGGGGTNINPVIDWLNEHKPEVAIIFTDGYFSPPQDKYHGELIWLIYDNDRFTTPYGRVIHF